MMTSPMTRLRRDGDTPAAVMSVDDLVLVRIATAKGHATRADLQRDLGYFYGPRAAGTQFRRSAELAIGALTQQGMITDIKSRLQATAAGQSMAAAILARPRPAVAGWEGARDALIGRAIGLTSLSAATQKSFDRAESLAALVLQHHFGISSSRILSIPDLRSELAIVALEKAFGDRIKTGLGKASGRGAGKGSGLPGKTGRLLAGQLLRQPREFSSDGKLVVALAVEVTNATDGTLDGLKLTLLRRLIRPVEGPSDGIGARHGGVNEARSTAPHPDNDQAPITSGAVASPRVVVRPDMAEFAGAVVDAARPISEGWPGNRKAFISLVWRAIRETRPDWELTEIAFKGMLAEAHRTGHVVLVGADLKERCDLNALEDSKILYKNTVWHFVRVED